MIVCNGCRMYFVLVTTLTIHSCSFDFSFCCFKLIFQQKYNSCMVSDSLHASAQQFHTNLIPILNSTVTPPSQAISNRPSLPPKPPFLSRPLAGSTTPQLYINSNSHSQVHTYENVANVNISSRLNVEKCSDAASRATGIYLCSTRMCCFSDFVARFQILRICCCLSVLYPACSNVTKQNLSDANLQAIAFRSFDS